MEECCEWGHKRESLYFIYTAERSFGFLLFPDSSSSSSVPGRKCERVIERETI